MDWVPRNRAAVQPVSDAIAVIFSFLDQVLSIYSLIAFFFIFPPPFEEVTGRAVKFLSVLQSLRKHT